MLVLTCLKSIFFYYYHIKYATYNTSILGKQIADSKKTNKVQMIKKSAKKKKNKNNKKINNNKKAYK